MLSFSHLISGFTTLDRYSDQYWYYIYEAKTNCNLWPAYFISIIIVAHDLTETEVIECSRTR